jgi:hypothetical protein
MFIKRIIVKHVISHEQSAAHRRLIKNEKKHENADICIKEKNSI